MKNKLVFIGNSIVNGFPMSRGRSFPGRIRAAIKEGRTSFQADVINKGANGETTADILQRFDHDVLDHEPGFVFIMTGTNDFLFREADPDDCMENLSEMARRSRDAGITPVYMTPIAVHEEKASRMWMVGMGIDYPLVSRQIEEFSDLIRKSGQAYIDSGAAWKEAAAGGETSGTDQVLREDFYIDGVHPTPDGYQILADIVLEWLEEHL